MIRCSVGLHSECSGSQPCHLVFAWLPLTGNEGDCLLHPPATWGLHCSGPRSLCFCPLPQTRVLAREIVSNVVWTALPLTLFCIKHFPPWKLPWLTAYFRIIINVFAQGFWNLISLFWTALSVFVWRNRKSLHDLFAFFICWFSLEGEDMDGLCRVASYWCCIRG